MSGKTGKKLNPMMSPLQNIHYAIGELAYAMAMADGKIQPEERLKFHDIVKAEINWKDYDFDISEIIFHILEQDKEHDSEALYLSAMHTLKTNCHYLSPELKDTIIIVVEKIARAFPPIQGAKKRLLEKLKEEIISMEGDPVFYENK